MPPRSQKTQQPTYWKEMSKGNLMYKRIFFGLTLFATITVLLTACAIVDTSTMSTGPAVHMGGSTIIQRSITINKGDMLKLVNDSSAQHIIVNDTWQGTTPKPGAEPGAPTVNKTNNGNDSDA